MPPKPETDPEVLAARRRKRRQNHSAYMKRWREQGEKIARDMTHLLEGAMVNRPMSVLDPESHDGVIRRGSAAALALTLSAHNITTERVVRTISDGLDSTKLKSVGDEMRSLPATQERLRASDLACRLLERAGNIPGNRHFEPASQIRVQVLVMGEDPAVEMRTITAEKTDE